MFVKIYISKPILIRKETNMKHSNNRLLKVAIAFLCCLGGLSAIIEAIMR